MFFGPAARPSSSSVSLAVGATSSWGDDDEVSYGVRLSEKPVLFRLVVGPDENPVHALSKVTDYLGQGSFGSNEEDQLGFRSLANDTLHRGLKEGFDVVIEVLDRKFLRLQLFQGTHKLFVEQEMQQDVRGANDPDFDECQFIRVGLDNK
eukprot:CAMPEP_0167818762 /NCGR_PEP_ID=MMETSP0112_2-20121227/5008_1 /TAXON_ID=91324 /ORGANISM="Lotharella globosa, Strain CCCM811" /LENGTH=149 /DNA_ID=CAMNT_0007718829 /DNA_START=706 /DNA_END=1157 /DNA_ORIENTATION=-